MLMTTSGSCSVPDHPIENKLLSAALAADQSDELAIGEPEYLSECSPKDRPWDQHRSQADQVATIYLNAQDSRWFSRLGERVGMCSQVLGRSEERRVGKK